MPRGQAVQQNIGLMCVDILLCSLIHLKTLTKQKKCDGNKKSNCKTNKKQKQNKKKKKKNTPHSAVIRSIVLTVKRWVSKRRVFSSAITTTTKNM